MSHHREPAEELFGKFFPLKARWVFPALLGFLALLFLLAWLIRYPDVTSIRVLLRKEGRVERYYAETPRRVAALPVENGQSADSGTVLLVWETGAGWEDIAALGRIPLPNDETAVARVGALELGELEAQWALARSAWEGYRSALETARAAVLAPAVARQLAVLADMESALLVQAETRAQEAELAKRTWERSQRLAKEDAVSLESVAAAEAAYLEKKAGAGSVELELQRVGLQREALEQEQLETALLDDKDLREKKERWEAEWRLLVARSGEWTRRNLILSVRPGKVLYSLPLKPGQWVDEGTPLFAVQAEAGPETWKAAGWLPAAGAGRIETGARVQLRLDAFPHGEYGALPGAVTHISPLSENDAFLVEIGLPDSLISDTGKTLSPGLESPATARIFTSRKRLLDRLFEVFRRW